jgi:N-acetylglucosaminyl-diphospho-decaprenol L-rhamnosyltransferase
VKGDARNYFIFKIGFKKRDPNVEVIISSRMHAGSVIIVTHNSEQHIDRCLKALASEAQWQIIVIDNASLDSTLQRARRSGTAPRIVANAKNVGFAAAVNQGAKMATGEVLLILNPDAIATAGSLDKLAEAMSREGVGAAGGMLAAADGSPAVGFTVRRFPNLGYMLAEVLLVNRLWKRNPLNRRYRCMDLDYGLLQEVEQPAGACLAVKRDIWESMGGFDEAFYPVWFEDVDFCRRLASHGWKIIYCPEAVFIHRGGHSVNQLPFYDRQVFWYRNLMLYFAKHHSGRETKILRFGITAGLTLRTLLSLAGLKPKEVGTGEAVRGYAHVMWRYGLRGGKGKAEHDAKSQKVGSVVI